MGVVAVDRGSDLTLASVTHQAVCCRRPRGGTRATSSSFSIRRIRPGFGGLSNSCHDTGSCCSGHATPPHAMPYRRRAADRRPPNILFTLSCLTHRAAELFAVCVRVVVVVDAAAMAVLAIDRAGDAAFEDGVFGAGGDGRPVLVTHRVPRLARAGGLLAGELAQALGGEGDGSGLRRPVNHLVWRAFARAAGGEHATADESRQAEAGPPATLWPRSPAHQPKPFDRPAQPEQVRHDVIETKAGHPRSACEDHAETGRTLDRSSREMVSTGYAVCCAPGSAGLRARLMRRVRTGCCLYATDPWGGLTSRRGLDGPGPEGINEAATQRSDAVRRRRQDPAPCNADKGCPQSLPRGWGRALGGCGWSIFRGRFVNVFILQYYVPPNRPPQPAGHRWGRWGTGGRYPFLPLDLVASRPDSDSQKLSLGVDRRDRPPR